MIKLLIGLLIIACILPLFIKGPDGEPIMSLSDWVPEVPDAVSDLAGEVTPDPVSSDPVTVYKWQDEDGQWHFSNQPPEVPDGAETMELSGDINLMESVEIPEKRQQPTTTASASTPSFTGPMTVAPEQVKEMMETVNSLQQSVDDRKKEIDALSGN